MFTRVPASQRSSSGKSVASQPDRSMPEIQTDTDLMEIVQQNPASLRANQILHLQRTVGNRATTRLLDGAGTGDAHHSKRPLPAPEINSNASIQRVWQGEGPDGATDTRIRGVITGAENNLGTLAQTYVLVNGSGENSCRLSAYTYRTINAGGQRWQLCVVSHVHINLRPWGNSWNPGNSFVQGWTWDTPPGPATSGVAVTALRTKYEAWFNANIRRQSGRWQIQLPTGWTDLAGGLGTGIEQGTWPGADRYPVRV